MRLSMDCVLRIARPVADLARSVAMYERGLQWQVLGRFENHDGFDGAMLGVQGAAYHLEFTHSPRHPVAPSPTVEDLLVFYMPDLAAWQNACLRMAEAGFREVRSHNPWWTAHGCTFEDEDSYRVVLCNSPTGT
jgi:catechol 2,3-dioxygenase-like lactoylglutathione lyase family enzyme